MKHYRITFSVLNHATIKHRVCGAINAQAIAEAFLSASFDDVAVPSYRDIATLKVGDSLQYGKISKAVVTITRAER